MNTESQPGRALHRYAVFCALATLGLIGLGGLVTSKGAGMAVPDWPTSYGYNMFWLPIHWWQGGIFYEHTHRLYAAGIGLLTTILAAWLWGREAAGKTKWMGFAVILVLVAMLGHRGHGNASGGSDSIPFHFKALAVLMPVLLLVGAVRSWRTRGTLRWLGMTAFFAVIFQGILGGFRVALYKDEIGIFHALLAQAFLVLLACIALVTSKMWGEFRKVGTVLNPSTARKVSFLTGLVFLQLLLGASMRHQHAGLAVPDFPLAHEQIWPATDAVSVARYNASRHDVREFEPITAGQIHLHMTHRLMAILVLAAAWMTMRSVLRDQGAPTGVKLGVKAWFALVVAQAGLGVLTVLTNKAADMATLHVVLGATILAYGGVLSVLTMRLGGLIVNCPSKNECTTEMAVATGTGGTVQTA